MLGQIKMYRLISSIEMMANMTLYVHLYVIVEHRGCNSLTLLERMVNLDLFPFSHNSMSNVGRLSLVYSQIYSKAV